MRSKSAHQAEMVNQILFGESFKVLDIRNNFSLIRLSHDDYEGWICNNQWIEINEESYKKIQKQTLTITIDILDIIKKKSFQPIVIGSILPNYKSNYAILNEEMYLFEGLTTQGFTEKKYIIKNALLYLNTPYLWGGRSPIGIDCSALVQMVYRLQGIRLPRDSDQQAKIGSVIKLLEEADAGDLAFFSNKQEQVTHVGILMEDKKIIHASGKVRIDKLDSKGILNEKGVYTHKLHLLKKIL